MVSSILRRFDREMRADPPAAPGERIERDADIVRIRGRYNLIAYWTFGPGETEAVVRREAAYFRGLRENVEWKVYAHDGPANLPEALAAEGSEPDPAETLMVLDLQRTAPQADLPAGITVRRVLAPDELAAYEALNTAAFGRPPVSGAAQLGPRLFGDGADTQAFIASCDGVPASAGRLELPPGRSFASLWAGGTLPALRGRGVYRALVAARARIARDRGYAYLTVDAADTSRPILERLGFEALTTVRGWPLAAEGR